MCIIIFMWQKSKPYPDEVTNWLKVKLLDDIERFLTRSDGYLGLDHPTCTRSPRPNHYTPRPVNSLQQHVIVYN